MRGEYWPKGVEIKLGRGSLQQARRVDNTRDAAYLLLENWPPVKGLAYKKAVIDCARAIRGDVSHDLIPGRLAEAAREAGLEYDLVSIRGTDPLESEIARICVRLVEEELQRDRVG